VWLSCQSFSSQSTSRQLSPSADISTSHDFICQTPGGLPFVRIV
jgi:hypothetical protein